MTAQEKAPRSRWLLPVVGVVAAVSLVATGTWVVLAPAPDPDVPVDGPPLTNNELVVATLDPNGLPVEATLVSTVTARGGEPRVVTDPASTTNVRYLDRRGAPETEIGTVLVEVGGPGVTLAATEATFDKPLPVAVHAEYRLDGRVVAPEAVLGAQGDVAVRYTVTNTTAQHETLIYQDASGQNRTADVPVFVPFSGSLAVQLPASLELVDAKDAARSITEEGRTLLEFPLSLAPPLGSFQQELTLTTRTSDGATPQATLAVVPMTSDIDPSTAFSADALAGAAEGNTELVAGLAELGTESGRLADGASDLATGSAALASGASALAGQVGGPLLAGSDELSSGADALASGADDLADGLAQAAPGADALAEATGTLTEGLDDLAEGLTLLAGPDGLPRAVESSGVLVDAAGGIADAVGSAEDLPWPPPGTLPWSWDGDTRPPDDLTLDELAGLLERNLPDLAELPSDVPAPTLVQSLRLLQQATDLLARVSSALAASTIEQKALLVEAGAAATSAASGAAALSADVCGQDSSLTPAQCQQLAEVERQAQTAASATEAAVAAEVKQGLLAAGVVAGANGLDAALGYLEGAVIELSTALRSDDAAEPGLVEGLELLERGLAESVAATDALRDGAEAAVGAGSAVSAGAGDLAVGLDEASSGASGLVDGADLLASGAAAQQDGVAALAEGATDLAGGAGATARGTAEVAEGIDVLTREGIGAVERSLVAASDEPALAAAWLSATDARAADALPYGAPDGAVGHAAYRLSVPASQASGTPVWQWALLGVGAAVVVGVAIRRRLVV